MVSNRSFKWRLICSFESEFSAIRNENLYQNLALHGTKPWQKERNQPRSNEKAGNRRNPYSRINQRTKSLVLW
jgi:hypothetical protein